MKDVWCLLLVCVGLGRGGFGGEDAGRLPGRVTVGCVDSRATNYATFQSHNQKVVANRYGIFTTHIRSRNEAYTAQIWWLAENKTLYSPGVVKSCSGCLR